MKDMKLGAFSISLNVKDINVSKSFYEKLGFKSFAGEITQNWLIMKNGETVIGLFQGMFPNNILTFNPGWNQNAENIDQFDDVRQILTELKNSGIKIESESIENNTGPASFVINDPDGNTILFDQHR